jgi:allantoicase
MMSEHMPSQLPGFARQFGQPRIGGPWREGHFHVTDEFFAPLERMLQDQPACSSKTSMTTTASGWMAGKAAASGCWAMISRWSAWRSPGGSTASMSTPRISPATTRRRPASRPAMWRAIRTRAPTWTEVLPHLAAGTERPPLSRLAPPRKSSPMSGCTSIPMGAWLGSGSSASPILDRHGWCNGDIELVLGAQWRTHCRILRRPLRVLPPAAGARARREHGRWLGNQPPPGSGQRMDRDRAGRPRQCSLGAIVDTAYFKGNFPDMCSIQAADMSEFGTDAGDAIITASMFWPELIGQQKLSGRPCP